MGNGRTRNVCFKGCGLMLERLYDVHNRMQDYNVSTRADVRVYKFKEEHFQLNYYK